jgi:CRISPR-associated protein Csx17
LIIDLKGCRTEPLASYLKALGVFRLVAEQKDPNVTGWWIDDAFRIETTFSSSDIEAFLLKEYSPTSILSPWNNGSGFFKLDKEINWIMVNRDKRFDIYRDDIERIFRAISDKEIKKAKDEKEGKNKGKTKKEGGNKDITIRWCRNNLSESAVEWIDAVCVIGNKIQYAPLLGSGGNDGRLELSLVFIRALESTFEGFTSTEQGELLRHALYGLAPNTAAGSKLKSGFYDPERVGGINQLSMPDQEAKDVTPVNPWDIILMFEGLIMLSGGLTKRSGKALSAFPFTVESVPTGGETVAEDAAKGNEIWAPIWVEHATYDEIRSFFKEGRTSIRQPGFGLRDARTSLEFSYAISSLGVDVGVNRFSKYGLYVRRGDARLAVPLGTVDVRHRSMADTIKEVLPFLNELNRNLRVGSAPASIQNEVANLNASVHRAFEQDQGMVNVVTGLGSLVRRFENGPYRIKGRDVPSKPPRFLSLKWLEWLQQLEDSVELRLAASLASLSPRAPISANILPVDENKWIDSSSSIAWYGNSLSDRLLNVLQKRIFMDKTGEGKPASLEGDLVVDPQDVMSFMLAETDDELLEDLLLGLISLKWDRHRIREIQGRWLTPMQQRPVLPTYVLIKTAFMPSELPGGVQIKGRYEITQLLSAGRIYDACEAVRRRLAYSQAKVSGFDPDKIEGKRLAAAMLIPVDRRRFLQHANRLISFPSSY